VIVLVVLTGWVVPALGGPARPVQDGDGSGPASTTSSTSSVTAPPDQDIIPEPNSGQAPEDAGDRGGALQLLVLVLVLAGVGVIATQVVRQARRNRPTPTR
jgi:hypothetical protein